MNTPEHRYIGNLDRPNEAEIKRQGLLVEQIVADSLNTSEQFKSRLSTREEDSGVRDIGSRSTVYVVIYGKDDRPVLGIQVTSALDKKIQQRKMQELKDRPFIRLPEMQPRDHAIPKALVFLERDESNSPETSLKVLNGIILSLKFDLSQTKNPQEIAAVQELLGQLEQEKKRYVH